MMTLSLFLTVHLLIHKPFIEQPVTNQQLKRNVLELIKMTENFRWIPLSLIVNGVVQTEWITLFIINQFTQEKSMLLKVITN